VFRPWKKCGKHRFMLLNSVQLLLQTFGRVHGWRQVAMLVSLCNEACEKKNSFAEFVTPTSGRADNVYSPYCRPNCTLVCFMHLLLI
jgi:hypothetical protein